MPSSPTPRGVGLAEARRLAKELLDDPVYRENLRSRLLAGMLDSRIETRLMEYAWGKPPETIEIGERSSLEDLTLAELVAKRAAVEEAVAAVLAAEEGTSH